MYPTSDKYKASIYAPSRTVTGRVTFDISDVTAAGDVSSITTTAQETSISDKSQLIDKVRNASYNLATLEPNRFKLDGSFSFPDDNLANNGEVGFCSDNLCDANGDFATYPTLTFQFGGTHSSVGLSITFDNFNDEYAIDFNMSAYDAAGALIESVDVTGNTETLSTPVGQLFEYKKVVVTIKKWSKGYRRARVLAVDFGIVRVYTDDTLMSMNLVEEMDLTTAQLPSPEFTFVVENSNREFNILNPVGFYKYLQQKQQVIAEIGVDTGGGVFEYVPLGNYLLLEWVSDEGSLTATFTARTNLDIMSSFEYENLAAKSNYSLYDLAVDVFNLCGITNYDIDTGLQAISTLGLVKKTNCKDVLQMIAIAGMANIYVTRENVITIKQSPASMGAAQDVIDLDNQYKEPQITLDPVVKTAIVSYYTDIDTSVEVSATASVDAGATWKVDSNTLINTAAVAQNVANWLLVQVGYRAHYKSNWRGNPAHELADVVAFDTQYGNQLGVFVTKNQMTYAGYLRAQTEARGVVE